MVEETHKPPPALGISRADQTIGRSILTAIPSVGKVLGRRAFRGRQREGYKEDRLA